MFSRVAVALVLSIACNSPVGAQAASDPCSLHVDLSPVGAPVANAKPGAAPADVSFGIYPLSVLGIQNTLRRHGEDIDDASDRTTLTTGPLGCVVDSIRGWERGYPGDPWIAKNLMTLEVVYLRAQRPEARELAAQTETWLEHDYPLSPFVEPARLALGKQHASNEADRAVAARLPATTAAEPVVAPFVIPDPTIVRVDLPPPVLAPQAAVFDAISPIVPIVSLTLAASPTFAPAATRPASPWDRFAPLPTDRRGGNP